MYRWTLRLLAVLLVVAALGPRFTLRAQSDRSGPEEDTGVFPQPFEIAGRFRLLADTAGLVEAELARLSRVRDLEGELEDARERLERLRDLIAATEVEYVRPEHLSRLRDRALQLEQRFRALQSRVGERLQKADEIRIAWAERRAFWNAWLDQLMDETGASVAEPEMNRAVERIDSVLNRVDALTPEIVRIQSQASRLRAEAGELAEQMASIRIERRRALSQRTEPILFSAAYVAQLARVEWRSITALQRSARAGFFPSNVGLVLLHVFLVGVFAVLARWMARFSVPSDTWSNLLRHPWSLAIFASTALLAARYGLAPALWDALVWAILAGAGARLATSLLRTRSVRVVLYLLAALYPLFLLAEALRIPPPLFRLGLAVIAFGGLIGFGGGLVRELRKHGSNRGAMVILGISILMWTAVLVSVVAGYYILSRWIIHSTITSAYVVFLVVFLMVLARGGLQTILRVEATGRLGFLRTVGVPIVERLLRLLVIALAIVATLNVLDIWGITATPLETWQRITSVGFTIGGVRITLDRVLMAAIIVYMTVLFSWVMRSFARSEVYPRWELERGVGDSINSLLHYVLIVVGIFIGLGALGIELQNFAILAGALGIGIGFGLQNVVNNFVSGLILLFERPVRVGDTVVIDEEFGTIQKIGLRSTTVLRVDQSEVIVPNADLVSEKVVNWTLSTPEARLVVSLGVAYGSNVARVLEIMREVADANPDVLATPPPLALFTGFGDSALDFELRVWVERFELRLTTKSAILTDIDRRFAAEGIEIPFPQRDLHVRSVDTKLLEQLSDPRTAGSSPSGPG